MQIKRNFAKRNTQVADTTATGNSVNNVKKAFHSNNYGKYSLPLCGEVPGSYYFSTVKHARPTKTQAKDDAIEVLYEMKYGPTIYKIANKIVPKDTHIETYYVKQIYIIGSTYFEEFVDAMADCIGLIDFDYEDVKNVTEYVELGYGDKSDIANIKVRCPMTSKEFISECRKSYNNTHNAEEDENADESYEEEVDGNYDYDW